jgi:hypothetical protein
MLAGSNWLIICFQQEHVYIYTSIKLRRIKTKISYYMVQMLCM